MEELDLAAITKRSIHGVFALVSRTFFIQVISFAVNFFLTVLLSPSIFGVYFIVISINAFFQYFSDIGLAAALIQQKEPVTIEELRTTFTIQQTLVTTVVVLGILLSGRIGAFYHLNADGVHLFQALAIAFFLSSLKTIPSIILERELRFEKLVIPQIVETLFFNVTALICALKGLGINSFSFAVLARGLSGVITMYILAPYWYSFGFSRKSAKKLLSFGIPFQANSFLALIKDDLLTLYIGKALPLAQVGYIGFAQKWAFTPLRLILDNVIRITFPAFSRLQEDRDSLRKAVEKAIFASSLIIFPSLFGLVILAPYFTHLIPKYSKWNPALLSLGLFAVNAIFSSISTILTNVLNAIGKIKTTLSLMIFWTTATWILTPFFIVSFGFNGVAAASALITLSAFFVVYLVKKQIHFRLLKSITSPFICSVVMGLFTFLAAKLLATNIVMLFAVIGLGAILYFAMMFVLSKEQMIADLKLIKENLRK